MSDNKEKLTERAVNDVNNTDSQEMSLDDERRVKVLSPGAMVAKRFFRNRVAMVGLIILTFMFLFSFLGGVITPYGEAEKFYTKEGQNKLYVSLAENNEIRYEAYEGQEYPALVQANTSLAIRDNKPTFEYNGTKYNLVKEGENFYRVDLAEGSVPIGIAYMDIVSHDDPAQKFTFTEKYEALKAHSNKKTEFTAEGKKYSLDEAGVISLNGQEIGTVNRYMIQPLMKDVVLTSDFKGQLIEAVQNKGKEFVYKDPNGEEFTYVLEYDAAKLTWSVKQQKETTVFDRYSKPSKAHWLGTDKNGMDMLTRLMYGGRVSLIIGFIVELIATTLGIILGGIAGYFGKWVDNLIMRIVDVFYCIPSTPLIIIIGASMDALRVDPQIRMIYLMLLLGFLSWPSVARMVRGQILSLREQEFMVATEACGISVSRRIFKHLIPNVMPQLIVLTTMGVGGVILTESTLSFLGLGVRFPFASWGNIINDVNDTFVLSNYWFIWIPAGFCILVTVLAYNLVGDGLRDAFDPKMKR